MQQGKAAKKRKAISMLSKELGKKAAKDILQQLDQMMKEGRQAKVIQKKIAADISKYMRLKTSQLISGIDMIVTHR